MVHNEKQRLRLAVIEFMSKKVLQTQYCNQVVECMISVMDKDNERNAQLAPKILNDTIKACGQPANNGNAHFYFYLYLYFYFYFYLYL